MSSLKKTPKRSSLGKKINRSSLGKKINRSSLDGKSKRSSNSFKKNKKTSLLKGGEELKTDTIINVKNTRYVLVKKLGEGAFGSVWKAFNKEKDEYVALKFLGKDDTQMEKFDVLNTKNGSPYILSLCGEVGKYNKTDYVLSLDLMGYSLQDLLNENNKKNSTYKVNTYTIAAIGYYMTCALEYLCSINQIHRDMKPDNILLDEHVRNRICLADFGLLNNAAFIKYTNTELDTTLDPNSVFPHRKLSEIAKYCSGNVSGTTSFFSLQQYKNNCQTFWDDLESLLYILLYLRDGKRPFLDIIKMSNEKIEQINNELNTNIKRLENGDIWSKYMEMSLKDEYLNMNELGLQEEDYEKYILPLIEDKNRKIDNVNKQKINLIEEEIKKYCKSKDIFGQLLIYIQQNNNNDNYTTSFNELWQFRNKNDEYKSKNKPPQRPHRLKSIPDYEYIKNILLSKTVVETDTSKLQDYNRCGKKWYKEYFKYRIDF